MPRRRTALFRTDQSKIPKLRLSKEVTNRPQALRQAAPAEHGSPILLYPLFLLSANQWASVHESRGPPPRRPHLELSWPIVGGCLPPRPQSLLGMGGARGISKAAGLDLGVTSPVPVKLLRQVHRPRSNLSYLRPVLMQPRLTLNYYSLHRRTTPLRFQD